MKRAGPIGIAVTFMLLLTACSGNKPSAQSSSVAHPESATGNAPPPEKVNKDQAQGNAAAVVTIPKDARYTIYCARIEGDLHVQRANRMKAELIQTTGMKDWYVIHDNAQSLLYYGYYRVIDDVQDPKETTRAQSDRQKISLMADNMGNRPFKGALLVELTSPDPQAPPEWNLTNAKGDYSLQVAAYKGSPQRKEIAVDAVRTARAQGIEAYYYHGPSASLVCVGAWPQSAVRITDASEPGTNTNPEQPLMIMPMTNDQQLQEQFLEAGRQANVKVIKPQVEILDPTLKAAMQQYPYNAVNGMHIKRTVNGVEQYDPSLLVPIPHDINATGTQDQLQPSANLSQGQRPYDSAGVLSVPAESRPQQPAPPAQPAPPPQQPGMGRLKSIGD